MYVEALTPKRRRRSRRRRRPVRRRTLRPRSTIRRSRYRRARPKVIVRPLRRLYRPIVVVRSPGPPTRSQPQRRPELNKLHPQAKVSLYRRGLLSGIWPVRLAAAGRDLVRFINRFYRRSGFELVVRDYYAGSHKRAHALLTIRYAQRLAKQNPNTIHLMSFERVIGYAPGGYPTLVTDLIGGSVRHELKSWARIDPIAVRRQLLRDMNLLGDPRQLRWVFNGQKLRMKKGDVVKTVRSILAKGGVVPATQRERKHWLSALNSIIKVI